MLKFFRQNAKYTVEELILQNCSPLFQNYMCESKPNIMLQSLPNLRVTTCENLTRNLIIPQRSILFCNPCKHLLLNLSYSSTPYRYCETSPVLSCNNLQNSERVRQSPTLMMEFVNTLTIADNRGLLYTTELNCFRSKRCSTSTVQPLTMVLIWTCLCYFRASLTNINEMTRKASNFCD